MVVLSRPYLQKEFHYSWQLPEYAFVMILNLTVMPSLPNCLMYAQTCRSTLFSQAIHMVLCGDLGNEFIIKLYYSLMQGKTEMYIYHKIHMYFFRHRIYHLLSDDASCHFFSIIKKDIVGWFFIVEDCPVCIRMLT